MEIADAEQSRKDILASNLQLKSNNYKSEDLLVSEMSKLGNYTRNTRDDIDTSKFGKGNRKRSAATLLAMPSTKSEMNLDDDNDDDSISDMDRKMPAAVTSKQASSSSARPETGYDSSSSESSNDDLLYTPFFSKKKSL